MEIFKKADKKENLTTPGNDRESSKNRVAK